MMSFGIMSGLLVVMACVVHYDPFGWFPTYLYSRERDKQQHAAHEPHGHVPMETVFDFQDHLWIPTPGTDPNVAFSVRPSVLVFNDKDYEDNDDDDDDDDFWTEMTNANEEEEGKEEKVTAVKSCSAGSGDDTDNGTCSNPHEVHAVPAEAPQDNDDDDVDNYVVTGDERDDDVY